MRKKSTLYAFEVGFAKDSLDRSISSNGSKETLHPKIRKSFSFGGLQKTTRRVEANG